MDYGMNDLTCYNAAFVMLGAREDAIEKGYPLAERQT